MTYQILEIANCHGGDISYLMELIHEYEDLKGDFGMKFQVFKWDEMAMPDYVKFEEFSHFYFTPEQWNEIFNEASKSKDIWLDLFDSYSIRILREHLPRIYGLKLQASSLQNLYLIEALSRTDLSHISLMLNIAGFPMEEIEKIKQTFHEKLNTREIILQAGFQGYPTALADSGLHKIGLLSKKFETRIGFTEHLSGNDPDSLLVPVMAAMQGAHMIEKHIMHSTVETRFDYYSSVKRIQYDVYLQNLMNYYGGNESFVNDRERKYLEESRQFPLLKIQKKTGDTLSITKDLQYRRTSQPGLTLREIDERIHGFEIIARDLNPDKTLSASDFRKARIGVIVACRMKSNRLPQKAILKTGKLSSIELCLKNSVQLKNTDAVILASSNLDEDAILEKHTYSDEVAFFKGDPDNVIKRFLDASEKFDLDIIVRITGDMQYVDDEIFQYLLKSHFAEGADYSAFVNAAPGMDMEIIQLNALKAVEQIFPQAEYSEYMTWYFQNNPDYFRVNRVELPSALSREYRLTLDYPEDLELFNRIEKHFELSGQEFSARTLFEFLDNHPEVAAINSHCKLVYKTNEDLIARLNKHTRIIRTHAG